MECLSKKIYLELPVPTEEDARSDQQRLIDGLVEAGVAEAVHMPVLILRKLYPLLDEAKWKITLSLSWNGENWEVVDIEKGDTSKQHFGLVVDLGSTTVVARLLDCTTGQILKEVSCFNRQIQWGTDILSRIFYCKDNKEKLEEVRQATVQSIVECMDKLDEEFPVSRSCLSMVIAGNTTMIHFLLGMDAFCVFYTPHAVHADSPGFQLGKELDIPVKGYVYCYPSKSNYLGGDIISGMIDTELYKKDEISVFFDIGTNGELVIGNKEFLLCGAGAAGPALEGGVVQTGMRADAGAVDEVKIKDGTIFVHVIGNPPEKFGKIGGKWGTECENSDRESGECEKSDEEWEKKTAESGSKEAEPVNMSEGQKSDTAEVKPLGICGSGIIDLIAELFLEGWINIRGKLAPEKSPLIQQRDGQLSVEYAHSLYFYQKDIDEFIRTKSAAHTMVEIMLRESGLALEAADRFYVAGAFGKHVSKESAITIGMYPDMDRDHIINAGNSSLEGAQKLLLNRCLLTDIRQILEEMVYIQFAEVEDFLELMIAAQALPHTDYNRYPTVMKKLRERQKDIQL